jgi:hypothetical protein
MKLIDRFSYYALRCWERGGDARAPSSTDLLIVVMILSLHTGPDVLRCRPASAGARPESAEHAG